MEEDKLELAKELEAVRRPGVQLLLPTDVVLADNFAPDANSQVSSIDAIPDGWMGLDIGPDRSRSSRRPWLLPDRDLERPWVFSNSTSSLQVPTASLPWLAQRQGLLHHHRRGDSVAAVEKLAWREDVSYSTGGGASLELLEGKVLLGVAALDEAA